MLKRYWLIAVVLGLATLSEVAHGQEPPADNTQSSEQSSEAQADITPRPIRVEVVESDEQAAARQATEQGAKQRELDDLAAQQGMNQATQNMANYALVQTILIFVGTLALIWTLLETRNATRAAAAAADAAKHANTTALEIANKQIRAYVGISNLRAKVRNAKNPDRVILNFGLNFSNSGQTPARKIDARVALVAYPPGRSRKLDEFAKSIAEDLKASEDRELHSATKEIGVEELGWLASNDIPVNVEGSVKYQPLIGHKPVRTDFKYRVIFTDFDKNTTAKFERADNGNTAT